MLLPATMVSGPPPIRPVLVGRPCRAHNVLAGRVIVDPRTGKEVLVLADMNETSGAELILIELASGAARSYRAPAGQGSWALLDAGEGKLVVGTFYDGRFMVFDMRRRRFVGTVPFAGESYIWNLAVGKDKRIYGGTYPGGKLGALDLANLVVEDCGAPAQPNMYLRYVSALPDGRILCSFGTEKPTTLIYDPSQKAFLSPPGTIAGITAGAVWNGYFVAGSAAFAGPELSRAEPPPFPTPPADRGGWSVDAALTSPTTLWLWQGTTLYRYRAGDLALERFADVSIPGARWLDSSPSGEVVAGVRGQDYFVVRRGASRADLQRIPTESGPRPTLFLRCDAQGRVWGGPHFGQTLFRYDPSSRKVVNTATISDHGGEVYDVAFRDGAVFAAAYAGGEIVRYDPRMPWDQIGHANPQTVAEVASRGYIRPTGGIILGDDGMLYSGWMAGYGTYGGAIAVTNLNTGDTQLIENPLGHQAIAGMAIHGGLAFIGTTLGANGLPDKKGEWARFGVLDLTNRSIIYRQELSGVSTVRVLTAADDGRRVVLSVGGRLCTADAPTWHVNLDGLPSAPKLTSNCVATLRTANRRRWLVYGAERHVIALDVQEGTHLTIAHLPAHVTNVAAAEPGNSRPDTIWVSCGADLYRLRLSREWRRLLIGEEETP